MLGCLSCTCLLHKKKTLFHHVADLHSTRVFVCQCASMVINLSLSFLLCRDVFAVHLTAMDAADAAVPGAYVCPVTDQVAGRGLPFVALPDCGHALSERALRQVFLRRGQEWDSVEFVCAGVLRACSLRVHHVYTPSALLSCNNVVLLVLLCELQQLARSACLGSHSPVHRISRDG